MKTQEILKKLVEEEKTLRNVINALERIEKLKNKGITTAFEREKIILGLEKFLGKMREDLRELITSALEEERVRVREEKEELRFEFMKKMEEELKKQGIKFKIAYPHIYSFPLKIAVELDRGRASILYGYDKLEDVGLEPGKIVRRFLELKKRITKPIKPEDEIEKIFEAYRRALLLSEKRGGERVPVSDVMVHYTLLNQPRSFYADPSKKNFREISRARFSYILFELRKAKVSTRNGEKLVLITATMDATRKREGFIWVPDDEEGSGTVYAYITFRRV